MFENLTMKHIILYNEYTLIKIFQLFFTLKKATEKKNKEHEAVRLSATYRRRPSNFPQE
jgi:hypothetical protein